MPARPSPNVSLWLKKQGIERICVVSPHLDDAVYSVCGLLQSDAGSQCLVTTVFTEADPTSDSSWALVTGFRDSTQEYQARRKEDQAAMDHLGVNWKHVGAAPSNWSTPRAMALAQELTKKDTGPVLVLLPAGAGGPPPGRIGAFWRRCMRQPFGSPPHAEHCAVRNSLLASLLQIETNKVVFVGFYAEIPYMWSDTVTGLCDKLKLLYPHALSPYWLRPKITDKLAVASQYVSQLVPILGESVEYRKRTLGHDELYLLPSASLKARV